MQLVVLLGILGLSLRSVVKVHTRRVQFDDAGLSDADFFGVRRVPWAAVKGMTLVNLNAKAQRAYDRTRLTERLGSRPKDDMGAWDVCGEQGAVLLRLYRNMVPQDALSALRERIQQQIRDGTRDAFGFAKRGSAPSDPAAADALIEEHEAIRRRMDQVSAHLRTRSKSVERVMKGFMALVFLVPLAGTCYLGYESLWFRFAAAQAQGRVVQAAGYPPALLVEYVGAAERMLLTKSDPSEDNTGVAVGAGVRVFYDPVDPDRVRLDLFDEMWFNVLALGGLTLFAGLLAAAAWGILRQAKP